MNQIPNIEETHNTEVEERVYEFYDKHSQYTSIEDAEAACDWLRTTLTQDRQHIHTSLVAAVEGKKRPTVCHTLHCLKGKAENHDMCVMNVPAVDLAYNQALEDTLTIINSIFKE